MNLKMINYRHLEKLLTSQEYFVWNSNFQKLLDFYSDEQDLSENSNDFDIWEIYSDYELDDLKDYKFVEVIKNGYDLVNKLFINQIQEEAKSQNKIAYVIEEKTLELSFKKTMSLLNDDSVDWIINPIFIHEDLISKCSLYKKENKSLYSLVQRTKTKLINYVKAYFDYNVLKKLNIDINEYEFFTYDKEKDYQKANDLSFVSSKYCWTQKDGPSKDIKIGIEDHSGQTIIEKIKSSIIQSKNTRNTSFSIVLAEDNFDEYIKQIKDAKVAPKPTQISLKDLTVWGENPFFNDLFDFDRLGLKKVSGNLINKKSLLSLWFGQENIHDLMKNKKSLSHVMMNKSSFNKEKIKNEVIDRLNKSKAVWYDFEGFSMPYTILPHTKPYQQIVFQLSLIRTDSENIITGENIVLDPKNIKCEDLIDIVNKIYWTVAEWYVVYNKNYEIKKLHEILHLLKKNEIANDVVKDIENKIETIESKTLDLHDMFRVTQSKTEIPPIFIPELLGFSSIKKIEKFINESNLNLKVMIKPYKDLEVQNGLMAMNKGIQRFLGSIGDKEWTKIKNDLAKYCENDVKAMIMTYYFIKYIYENK